MIGHLMSCDQGQMAAFANHATTVFGGVTEWDSATVGTIGTMIGIYAYVIRGKPLAKLYWNGDDPSFAIIRISYYPTV